MTVKHLFRVLRLEGVLADIAHHIGGDPVDPESVVLAAESARERLNRLQGYSGIPRDADGNPVAFAVVGR